MPGDQPAAECRDLVVRYGALTAVDGLSLEVRAGEVLALLGPNGAGKTSTVECLEGYRRPSAGTVRVLRYDPVADHRRVVPSIGVMLQRGGVYPMLAPRQVLELFAAYFDHPADPVELLELVGLDRVARTRWRHLSGGEQQRLSLALALVGRPQVAFLDEPTAGVDPEGRQTIRAVIRQLAEDGTAVLLTTHELAEAERVAERVAIIRGGRLVAQGTPAALAGGGALRFGARPHLDLASLGQAVGATVEETDPGHYRVDGPSTPERAAALTAWLASHQAGLTDLRTGDSLEEAYLALVGGDAADAPGDDRRPGHPERRREHGRGRGARQREREEPGRGARHRGGKWR